MARLSRLLSAISLGVAVTAALGAAVVAVEYNPVRRAPSHLPESVVSARVIVKYRQGSSILSVSGRSESIQSASNPATASAGPQKASVMGSRLGLTLSDGHVLGERTQVMMSSGMSSSALAAALAADGDVEWAVVDKRRFIQAAPVNDPLYPDDLSITAAPNGPASGQWYLRAPGTDASGRNVAASINVEPAWAITHGAASIVIGDVDTGITQHPDLDSKMLTGYDFVGWGASHNIYDLSTKGEPASDAVLTANDGNLADPDPSDPGDYVTATENSTVNGPFWKCNDGDQPNPGQPVPSNSSWHGTQTASLLGAATNDGIGMAGTGYDTTVIPARALGKCGGYDSDIIAAALWAGGITVADVPANAHPARVINMSLGSQEACNASYVDALTALRNKGVVVVAAAGNDEGLPVSAPANCKPATTDTDQTPIVVAVAGLRHAGTKVGFSDIGPEVTIAAPGGNCINTASGTPCLYPILTAVNSGTTTPVSNGGTYSDGLNNVSLGTSFATPMVTGTVALMLSAAPTLTNAQIVEILQRTARPFPAVSDTSPNPATCTVPVAAKKDSNGNVTVPGSAKQDECICTTGTCGAGMLDAGVAVARAWAEAGHVSAQPVADITTASSTLLVGNTLSLSGTTSALGSGGASITSYTWSLPDRDALVSLSSTSDPSITVTGVSAGATHVMLKIVDANGLTSQYTIPLTVTAKVVVTGNSGGGGGGGGAANPAWLAALAIAGLLLGPRARRPRARRPRA